MGEDAGARRGRFEACRAHLLSRARGLIPPALRAEVAASDLVQEAFVDAQRHAGSMPRDDSDQLRAWLHRILVLNLAERRRSAARRHRAGFLRAGGSAWADAVDRQPTPRAAAVARERADRLDRAIARLPEPDRLVIRWRYWDRLDFAEIGLRLGGISDEAARKRHARACKALYRMLEGAEP